MDRKSSIGAVILAAGNSRRFGSNKLLHEIEGRPMYSYVYRNMYRLLQEGQISCLILVTQYDEIRRQLEAAGDRTAVVMNREPELGISHSVFLGLEKLKELLPESESCIFAVADQPYISYASLKRLTGAWRDRRHGIIACACGERIGNPVLFSRKYYGQLELLSGDVGGKQIVKRNMGDVDFLQIPESELEDIDVPDTEKRR